MSQKQIWFNLPYLLTYLQMKQGSTSLNIKGSSLMKYYLSFLILNFSFLSFAADEISYTESSSENSNEELSLNIESLSDEALEIFLQEVKIHKPHLLNRTNPLPILLTGISMGILFEKTGIFSAALSFLPQILIIMSRGIYDPVSILCLMTLLDPTGITPLMLTSFYLMTHMKGIYEKGITMGKLTFLLPLLFNFYQKFNFLFSSEEIIHNFPALPDA